MACEQGHMDGGAGPMLVRAGCIQCHCTGDATPVLLQSCQASVSVTECPAALV
jgi:hypothetical protein